MTSFLNDFHTFFEEYKRVFNSQSVADMAKLLSKELTVRWAYPNHNIGDWGYEEACKGWEEAYKGYADKNPKWYFQNIYTSQISETEVMAAFLVTFALNGIPTDSASFFVNTFRREVDGWKLIREYVEASLPKKYAEEV